MQQTITTWIGTYLNLMAHVAPGHAGKLGFRLFGRPTRRRIKPGEKQFLDTAETISFQHGKLNIRGYQWGRGPKKILLLHGWQSHSARWEEVVRAFPESGYTVYAIDAPGHGQSGGNFFSAPLYGEVIMQFGEQVGKLDGVVGHSLGAFSTLYARSEFKRPDTDCLIIMATPGGVKDFITYFRQRLGLSEKTLECIQNHFENEIGLTYEEFSIFRFTEQLDVPGLIIHDKYDRFAPFRYAEQLNKKWTNSRLIATEGLGHPLSGSGVTDAILDFVSGQNNHTYPGVDPSADGSPYDRR